jgi:hypothetical protein
MQFSSLVQQIGGVESRKATVLVEEPVAVLLMCEALGYQATPDRGGRPRRSVVRSAGDRVASTITGIGRSARIF